MGRCAMLLICVFINNRKELRPGPGGGDDIIFLYLLSKGTHICSDLTFFKLIILFYFHWHSHAFHSVIQRRDDSALYSI